MLRVKDNETEHEPKNKRTKINHTPLQTIPFISVDCWSEVILFLYQYDVVRLASVSKVFNTIVSPTIDSLKEFLNRRSKIFIVSKIAYHGHTLFIDKVNEDTVLLFDGLIGEENNITGLDPLDAIFFPQFTFLQGNGARALRCISNSVVQIGDHQYSSTKIVHKLTPLAQKMGHLFHEGDVIVIEQSLDDNESKSLEGDDYPHMYFDDYPHVFRNHWKFVFHQGHFWTLESRLGDDYGSVPHFFDIEMFPPKYWFNSITHNRTRTFKISQNNLFHIQDSRYIERCKNEEGEDKRCKDVCTHAYEYRVHYTKDVQVPFNISYEVMMYDLDKIEWGNYLMGEVVNNFRLE